MYYMPCSNDFLTVISCLVVLVGKAVEKTIQVKLGLRDLEFNPEPDH